MDFADDNILPMRESSISNDMAAAHEMLKDIKKSQEK